MIYMELQFVSLFIFEQAFNQISTVTFKSIDSNLYYMFLGFLDYPQRGPPQVAMFSCSNPSTEC